MAALLVDGQDTVKGGGRDIEPLGNGNIISLFFEIEQHHSNNSNRLKIPDYSHSARNTSFP